MTQQEHKYSIIYLRNSCIVFQINRWIKQMQINKKEDTAVKILPLQRDTATMLSEDCPVYNNCVTNTNCLLLWLSSICQALYGHQHQVRGWYTCRPQRFRVTSQSRTYDYVSRGLARLKGAISYAGVESYTEGNYNVTTLYFIDRCLMLRSARLT